MRRLRRLGSIILAAVLALALTGCSPKTAYEVYAAACGHYEEAAGVTITFDSRLDFLETLDTEGRTESVETDFAGTYNLEQKDGVVVQAAMEGTLTVGLYGTPVTIPVEFYYTEGRLYVSMNNSKYYKEISWEEAVKQMGPESRLITGFAEADFRELTLTEKDKENSILSFMIPAAQMDRVIGIEERWSGFANEGLKDGVVSFQDIRGYMTIGEKQIPQSQNLTITGSVNLGDRNVAVTNEITMDITLKDAASVTLPDLTGYEQFS